MEYDKNEADASDVVDRRGASGGGGAPDLGDILGGALGGGRGRGRGVPLPRGKAGGGMIGLIVVVVLGFLGSKLLGGGGFDISNGGLGGGLGGNSSSGFGQADRGDVAGAAIPESQDPDLEVKTFSNVVISDLNRQWGAWFSAAGRSYPKTKLVLYTGQTSTGCGTGQSGMGPFYCPADSLVYVDLSFFRELQTRFDSPGDFPIAYVIAHEVGHHVQNVLGISEQANREQSNDPDQANEISVRVELQADCLAGVWAHTRYERGQSDPSKRLDDGDIEEALRAAGQIGDDTLQREATGRVRPEAFTHGTSEQRQRWLKRGYDSGDANQCDTFSVDSV